MVVLIHVLSREFVSNSGSPAVSRIETPILQSGYKIKKNSAGYFKASYGSMDQTHLTFGRDVDRAGLYARVVTAEPQAAHHERWYLPGCQQMGSCGSACPVLQRRAF